MKITGIRALQPIAPNSPLDWRTNLGQILVIVETDTGVVGYGVGGGGKAAIHVIETELRPLLVGRDVEPVEDHWQAMYDATLPYGRQGLAIMALSGVDLALWDVRGKVGGMSVAEWIVSRVPHCAAANKGLSVKRSIPTYVTVWDEVRPEQVKWYSAVKLHVGNRGGTHVVNEVVSAVRRARDTLGPDRDLMIDAWMKWDVSTTLKIAEQIAPLGIGWIEEPLSPDDLAGYEQLRDCCPIPIAGGEHEFTSRAFRELIDRRLHQVLQPDVCWCGGLTELIRIYEMANAAGVRVCPHRGCEVWALHAIAALDPNPLAESGRPWMTWVGGQPEIVDGLIRLTDAVGFGVTIDEHRLLGV